MTKPLYLASICTPSTHTQARAHAHAHTYGLPSPALILQLVFPPPSVVSSSLFPHHHRLDEAQLSDVESLQYTLWPAGGPLVNGNSRGPHTLGRRSVLKAHFLKKLTVKHLQAGCEGMYVWHQDEVVAAFQSCRSPLKISPSHLVIAPTESKHSPSGPLLRHRARTPLAARSSPRSAPLLTHRWFLSALSLTPSSPAIVQICGVVWRRLVRHGPSFAHCARYCARARTAGLGTARHGTTRGGAPSHAFSPVRTRVAPL